MPRQVVALIVVLCGLSLLASRCGGEGPSDASESSEPEAVSSEPSGSSEPSEATPDVNVIEDDAPAFDESSTFEDTDPITDESTFESDPSVDEMPADEPSESFDGGEDP